jgi:hypothetical protein
LAGNRPASGLHNFASSSEYNSFWSSMIVQHVECGIASEQSWHGTPHLSCLGVRWKSFVHRGLWAGEGTSLVQHYFGVALAGGADEIFIELMIHRCLVLMGIKLVEFVLHLLLNVYLVAFTRDAFSLLRNIEQ